MTTSSRGPTDPRTAHAGAAGAGAAARDNGSVTVEAVGLLIPTIGAAIVLLVFALHLAAAGQALTSSAAAAARAASLQPSSTAGLTAARQALEADLGSRSTGAGQGCHRVVTTLDTRSFRPGGTAAITVTCTLSTRQLTGIVLPGNISRTVTSRAPIDRYSAVTG